MDRNTDRARIVQALTAAASMYDKVVDEAALTLWLDALDGRPADAVLRALREHLRDPDAGRWMPRPADLIGRIRSRERPELQLLSAPRHEAKPPPPGIREKLASLRDTLLSDRLRRVTPGDA